MKIKTDLSSLNNSIQISNLEVANTIKKIKIEKITKNENNFYSMENIEELSENIKVNGLITPLIVTKVGDNYKLISGHRRFEALKLLDKKEVEAILVEYEDEVKEELALLEANSQRILTKAERDQEIKLKKDLYEKLGYKNISKILGEEYNLSERQIRRSTNEKSKKVSKELTKDEEILNEVKKLERIIRNITNLNIVNEEFNNYLEQLSNYISAEYQQQNFDEKHD